MYALLFIFKLKSLLGYLCPPGLMFDATAISLDQAIQHTLIQNKNKCYQSIKKLTRFHVYAEMFI